MARDDRGGDIITFNDRLMIESWVERIPATSVGCNNQDMVSEKGLLKC